MSLNLDYLHKLSELLVAGVTKSDYYANLSENQRKELDARIREEEVQGRYPFLPGATQAELTRLSKAFRQELGILLPDSVIDVLCLVDGFDWNGVVLYGVDTAYHDDQIESGMGILEENRFKWADYAETRQRYLFLGEVDLYLFTIDLSTGQATVLDRLTLVPKHRFSTLEHMINGLLHQALFPSDSIKHSPDGGLTDKGPCLADAEAKASDDPEFTEPVGLFDIQRQEYPQLEAEDETSEIKIKLA